MIARIAAAFVAAGLLASAASSQERLPERLLALTPESVAASATIKDDALEVDATITTAPADPARRGLFAVHWNDTYLRAFVSKKTGKAVFQVYQRLAYLARTYREYTSVNYETLTDGGPANADLIALERDRNCRSTGVIGGCIHYEDVAFGVDEALLRKVAALYAPGDARPWRFRFKSQAGVDVDAFLMPAEVAGELRAVDEYRKTHGFGQ